MVSTLIATYALLKTLKIKKKEILGENIKNLNDLSNNIKNLIKRLKHIFEYINKNKEDLKLKIMKIFTKIRAEINEREDNILKEIDTEYENLYFKEDIIKKSEKLPDKIKLCLDNGKNVDTNWSDDNKPLNLLKNFAIILKILVRSLVLIF